MRELTNNAAPNNLGTPAAGPVTHVPELFFLPSCTILLFLFPLFLPICVLQRSQTSDGGACFVSSTFSINVINHHPFAICVRVWVFTILQQKKIHNIPRGKSHLQNSHVLQRNHTSDGFVSSTFSRGIRKHHLVKEMKWDAAVWLDVACIETHEKPMRKK